MTASFKCNRCDQPIGQEPPVLSAFLQSTQYHTITLMGAQPYGSEPKHFCDLCRKQIVSSFDEWRKKEKLL